MSLSPHGVVADGAPDNHGDRGGGRYMSNIGKTSTTTTGAFSGETLAPSSGDSPGEQQQLEIGCSGISEDHNIFKFTAEATIICTSRLGAEITGVDWMYENDDGKTYALFSHNVTTADTTPNVPADFSLTEGSADSVQMALRFAGSKPQHHQAQPMFIRTNWTKSGQEGWTNSQRFTTADVTNSPTAIEAVSERFDINRDQGTYDDENSSSADNGGQTSDAGSATGGHTAAQPTSIGEPSSGGHKSLSTGAIAGIAVAGAVVFLGLISALIWFIVKRKKQTKAPAQYTDETKATAFLHDKDGMHHTDSVVAPYSDDGHNRRSSGPAPQPQPVENEQRALSPPAVRPAAPGVSSSVAHLVEEGMTEDDIRRLEEEERHLDAEIERNANSKSP